MVCSGLPRRNGIEHATKFPPHPLGGNDRGRVHGLQRIAETQRNQTRRGNRFHGPGNPQKKPPSQDAGRSKNDSGGDGRGWDNAHRVNGYEINVSLLLPLPASGLECLVIRSSVCLLCTARFTRVLRCAYSFTGSLDLSRARGKVFD